MLLPENKSIKSSVKWTVKDACYVLLAEVGFIFFLSLLVILCFGKTNEDSRYLMAIFASIFAIAIVFFLLHRRKEKKSSLGLIRNNNGRLIIAGIALGFLYFALTTILFHPEYSKEILAKIGTFKIISLLAIFITTKGFGSILLAPFAEEILFRGLFYQALLKKLNKLPSVIIVSVLFSLLHFESSYKKLLFIFGVSIIATLLFDKYRNLSITIAFHSTINYFIWVAWIITV